MNKIDIYLLIISVADSFFFSNNIPNPFNFWTEIKGQVYKNHVKPKKLIICFPGIVFKKMMQGAAFYFIFLIKFYKNDVSN